MTILTIDAATKNDIPLILSLIKELAIYEKEPDAAQATAADLEIALFGNPARAHALICRSEGEVLGFALYFYNYSTWTGKAGIYLEDLFVVPQHRGAGAGKALLQYLAKTAVTQQCSRVEWSVLDWNRPAIDFYESVGAKPMSEWTVYRLTGDALEQFARS